MKRIIPVILAALLMISCTTEQQSAQQGDPNNTTEAHNTEEVDPTLTFTVGYPPEIKMLSQPKALATDSERPQLSQAETTAYLQATDKLATALLEKDGNSAVTPLSLYVALSMLTGGAEGETQAELCNLLGLEADELATLNEKLMQLNNNEVMKTVNSLWIMKGWPVKQDYMKLLSESYYAWINEADFTDGSTAELISEWIGFQTEGMIEPSLNLPDETVMALVNATLLEDEWVDNFQPENTQQQDFYSPSGLVKVDMMKQEKLSVSSWAGVGYRAISLPLKQSNMLFVLPGDEVSPQTLLKEYSLSSMFNLDGSAEAIYPQIEIGIPKFDISSSSSAEEALQALGVQRAFDSSKAEFAPMSSEQVWVDQVVHGTRVIVHEDGVAAAGYTMVAMAGSAMLEPELQQPFILDRPFLFCITNTAGLPVFIGVVNQPNEPGSVQAPGPEMEDGVPVRAKEGVQKTIDRYFSLLPQLDADIRDAAAAQKINPDQSYSSQTSHDLEFTLQNQELTDDQNIINDLKAIRYQDTANTEAPMTEFKIAYGDIIVDGLDATQQIELTNAKGSAEITITLTSWEGSDWYITNLSIPPEMLGQAEQDYYKYKAEFVKEKGSDYDPAALREYVLGKAAQ